MIFALPSSTATCLEALFMSKYDLSSTRQTRLIVYAPHHTKSTRRKVKFKKNNT